jgi:hypothetical protein
MASRLTIAIGSTSKSDLCEDLVGYVVFIGIGFTNNLANTNDIGRIRENMIPVCHPKLMNTDGGLTLFLGCHDLHDRHLLEVGRKEIVVA